jgi:glycosyltransferase involved in cell wall biosynthesis
MPSRPRILVNATTCKKGGSLQMATMFLRQLLRAPAEFEWCFAVSAPVHRELAGFEQSLPSMEIFDTSPARHRASRRRLLDLERQQRPDLVFTLAGPAYVKFAARHVIVCAEPWVSHAGLTAYRALRFPDEWLVYQAFTRYKTHWFRKADAWILQTQTALRGFVRRVGVPADRCRVIPATCDPQFGLNEGVIPFPSADEKLRLLCLSAYYKHKNLTVIPAVASNLEQPLNGRPFEFVLTLPPDQPHWKALVRKAERLQVSNRLLTVGVVPVSKCPALYRSCHILFLPSVLEMFTATYPEAMAMGMPIVTSDLDFARDVCGDAALYFAPRDPAQAAARVAELVDDAALWQRLVGRGKARLAQLPSAEEQYEMNLDCFRDMLGSPRFSG